MARPNKKGSLIIDGVATEEQPKSSPCETLNDLRQIEESIQSKLRDPESYDQTAKVFSTLLEMQTPHYQGHANLKLLLDTSRSNDIFKAVQEWSIINYHNILGGSCICDNPFDGKTYTLENRQKKVRLVLDARCAEQIGKYFHRFGNSGISWGFNPIRRKLRKGSYRQELESMLTRGSEDLDNDVIERIHALVKPDEYRPKLERMITESRSVLDIYPLLARAEPDLTDRKSDRYLFRMSGKAGILEWISRKDRVPEVIRQISSKAKDGVVPLDTAELGLLYIYVMGRRRYEKSHVLTTILSDIQTITSIQSSKRTHHTVLDVPRIKLPTPGKTMTVTEAAHLLKKYPEILDFRVQNNAVSLAPYTAEVRKVIHKLIPVFIDQKGKWHDQNKKDTTIYTPTLTRGDYALIRQVMRRVTLDTASQHDLSLCLGYPLEGFEAVVSDLAVMARKVNHLEKVVAEDATLRFTLESSAYSIEPGLLDSIDNQLLRGGGYFPLETFGKRYPNYTEPLECILEGMALTAATERKDKRFIRFIEHILPKMQDHSRAGLYFHQYARQMQWAFHRYSTALWTEDGSLGHAIIKIRSLMDSIPGILLGPAVPDLSLPRMTREGAEVTKELAKAMARSDTFLQREFGRKLKAIYKSVKKLDDALFISYREGLQLTLETPFNTIGTTHKGDLFSHPDYTTMMRKYELFRSANPLSIASLDALRHLAESDYLSEEWQARGYTLDFDKLQSIYAEVRPLMDSQMPRVWTTQSVEDTIRSHYDVLRSMQDW